MSSVASCSCCAFVLLLTVFFFSSRRRHTRFDCDWSSTCALPIWLGPLRSAKLLMYSVDFGPIEQAQHEGRWDDAAALLEDAARRLQQGGADGVLLCTNTMHKLADRIAAAVRIQIGRAHV